MSGDKKVADLEVATDLTGFSFYVATESEDKRVPSEDLKNHLELDEVDNTSDADKPVSTATQTALDGKQPASANLDTYAGIAPSANVQAILGSADYAAIRALLDLEAGTDFYSKTAADAAFQPLNANLTALAAAGITNALLPDMAQATIKGRASGAGTGDPTDLSAAQVFAILGVSSLLQGALDETTFTAFFAALGLGYEVGSWTPTGTLGTNVSSLTPGPGRYIRFGKILIMGGVTSVDPVSLGVASGFALSLPIVDDTTTFRQLHGVAAAGAFTEVWAVQGSAANDNITFIGLSQTSTNHEISFIAIYEITAGHI
jgi:hypothetical protein